MLATRSMAALAGDSVFQEWRLAVAVLCAEHRTHLACVTPETSSVDRAIEADFRLAFIPGRRIPERLLRVPGHRQLVQVSFALKQEAPAGRIRSDEIVERGAALGEMEAIVRDSIPMSSRGELRWRNRIDLSARARHGSA